MATTALLTLHLHGGSNLAASSDREGLLSEGTDIPPGGDRIGGNSGERDKNGGNGKLHRRGVVGCCCTLAAVAAVVTTTAAAATVGASTVLHDVLVERSAGLDVRSFVRSLVCSLDPSVARTPRHETRRRACSGRCDDNDDVANCSSVRACRMLCSLVLLLLLSANLSQLDP